MSFSPLSSSSRLSPKDESYVQEMAISLQNHFEIEFRGRDLNIQTVLESESNSFKTLYSDELHQFNKKLDTMMQNRIAVDPTLLNKAGFFSKKTRADVIKEAVKKQVKKGVIQEPKIHWKTKEDQARYNDKLNKKLDENDRFGIPVLNEEEKGVVKEFAKLANTCLRNGKSINDDKNLKEFCLKNQTTFEKIKGREPNGFAREGQFVIPLIDAEASQRIKVSFDPNGSCNIDCRIGGYDGDGSAYL